MDRHHTGSGRRPVVPPDWAAHHRPVSAGAMTATVEIRPAGGTPGAFNDTTGKRDPATPFAAHYTGPARIQPQPVLGTQQTISGGQEISSLTYLVAIELAGADGCKVGDLVKVTAVDDNGDPTLVDRTLTVEGVARGSLSWERDLVCTDDLG